jgi:hypothetical protein
MPKIGGIRETLVAGVAARNGSGGDPPLPISPSQRGPDASGRMVERSQWTGSYICENEWQSFRTRRDRSLELTSAAHEYPEKGRYKIAVKVIDIFGNDTTKVVEVAV